MQVDPPQSTASLPCPACLYPIPSGARTPCPECGHPWSQSELTEFWDSQYRRTDFARKDFIFGVLGFGAAALTLTLVILKSGNVGGAELAIILTLALLAAASAVLLVVLRRRLIHWDDQPLRLNKRLATTGSIVFAVSLCLGVAAAAGLSAMLSSWLKSILS